MKLAVGYFLMGSISYHAENADLIPVYLGNFEVVWILEWKNRESKHRSESWQNEEAILARARSKLM